MNINLLYLKEELKVTLNWGHLLVLALLGIMLIDLLSTPLFSRQITNVLGLMELFLPLAAALLTSTTVGCDWEQRTIEWRICMPGGPSKLLWSRFALSILLWLLVCLVGAIIMQYTYLRSVDLQMPWSDLITLLIPPGLFLASLATIATLISRISIGGYITAAIYWGMDLFSEGRFNGPFHILYFRSPLESFSYQETRWWLLGGALLISILTFILFKRAERWVK